MRQDRAGPVGLATVPDNSVRMEPNQSRKRRKRVTTVIASIAALIAFAIWFTRDRSPQLLDISRPVLHCSEGRDDRTLVTWTSDSTAFVVQFTQAGYGRTSFASANRFDLHTGRLQPIDALRGALSVGASDPPVLAPDASYLLVNRWNNLKFDYSTIAYGLDGGKLHEWRSPSDMLVARLFLKNNSGWIERYEYEGTQRAVRHQISGPDTILANPPFGRLVGQCRNGDLVTYVEEVKSATVHRIRCDTLLARPSKTHEYLLPLPAKVLVEDVKLSPSADRLLFVLRSGGDPLYPKFVRDHAPSLGNARRPMRWVLWTCNLNGSKPREIGEVRLDYRRYVSDTQWRADSRSISFILDGWLRIVKAE